MRLRALAVGIIGSFFDIKLTFMSYAFKMCYRWVTSAAIGPLRLPLVAVIKMKSRFLLSLMPFRCKNGIIGMGLVDYAGSWGHFWFMLLSICCIMVQVTFCVCAWLSGFSIAFSPSFFGDHVCKKELYERIKTTDPGTSSLSIWAAMRVDVLVNRLGFRGCKQTLL